MFNYSKVNNKPILLTILMICGIIALTGITIATDNDYSRSEDYASELEKQIRSGSTSTAAEIVPYHPRIWLKGSEDWDKDKFGSYAWRIVHGPAMSLRFPAYAHDDLKYIFYFVAGRADNFFHATSWHDTHIRLLSLITTGKSIELRNEWNLPFDLPSTSKNPDYDPQYTRNEYYIRAKEKLLALANSSVGQSHSEFIIQVGAAAYDWLMGETLENGEPVLSDVERTTLQNRLIAHALFMKSQCHGREHFFQSKEIYNYMYPQVGMALYEPEGKLISIDNNKKAKEFLDDFDTYWIGKILPALNEQGGDGGWHGGITRTTGRPGMRGGTSADNTIPVMIAPLLFAHYTATGKTIEQSVFSTGFMKNFVEWQLYMIPPSELGKATYYPIGGEWMKDNRSPWTFPRSMFARRRASQDAEQRKLAELGAWLGYVQSNYCIGYAGSWDTQYKLLFEDNWVNPRNPEELGYGSRHFKKLGWVFMREGFISPNNISAIFVCQRYRWSRLDKIAQNSFFLGDKKALIKGWDNTIFIDDNGSKIIDKFPTLSDGMESYAPGSIYDIGPGIQIFENNRVYTYVVGDASHAYDRNKLEKFTREIVYLKPDKFIIFDFVLTKKASYKKNWIIHPGAAPKSIGDSLIFIKNESSSLWIKRLLPVDADQIINNNIIKVTPSHQISMDLFLFILQVTDSNLEQDSPKVVVDQAKLISESNKIGVLVDNWKVLFNVIEPKGITVTKAITDFNLRQDKP